MIAGDDLRSHPIEDRKAQLARLLERAGAGLQFNEHIEGKTARPCSPMPASSGVKGSFPSARAAWDRIAAARGPDEPPAASLFAPHNSAPGGPWARYFG
jgi:hypothetical protein